MWLYVVILNQWDCTVISSLQGSRAKRGLNRPSTFFSSLAPKVYMSEGGTSPSLEWEDSSVSGSLLSPRAALSVINGGSTWYDMPFLSVLLSLPDVCKVDDLLPCWQDEDSVVAEQVPTDLQQGSEESSTLLQPIKVRSSVYSDWQTWGVTFTGFQTSVDTVHRQLHVSPLTNIIMLSLWEWWLSASTNVNNKMIVISTSLFLRTQLWFGRKLKSTVLGLFTYLKPFTRQ